MSELGHPCSETQGCTLPNIYCSYPHCYKGKQNQARYDEAQALKNTPVKDGPNQVMGCDITYEWPEITGRTYESADKLKA